jgi:hypothetical protein
MDFRVLKKGIFIISYILCRKWEVKLTNMTFIISFSSLARLLPKRARRVFEAGGK